MKGRDADRRSESPRELQLPWGTVGRCHEPVGGVVVARAKRSRGRIAAAALAALPAWLPGLFQLFVHASTNYVIFRPIVGASIYTYRLPAAAAGVSALLFLGYFVLFSLTKKLGIEPETA